jgi:2-phosphosulfolactate phosphatase
MRRADPRRDSTPGSPRSGHPPPVILEVAFLPLAALALERKACIVVDALRASATVAALLDAGAAEIELAPSVDDARRMAERDRANTWLVGEVGGLAPPGFDESNSPTAILAARPGRRRVVFATSNGTRALRRVADAPCVLVGGLVNAGAVLAYALGQARRRRLNLCIVCSGDEGGTLMSLEDLVSAGVLVELALAELPPPLPVEDPRAQAADWVALDESADVARRLYRSFLPCDAAPLPPDPFALASAFAAARHGRELPRLGFGADVAHCSGLNRSRAVPLLERRGEGLFIVAAG